MINNKPKQCFLVFDQGGHATRAIIYSQTGNILFHCESQISTTEKPGAMVEHNPDELLNSFYYVINKSAEFLQKNQLRLHSAGLATQRSSFVPMDKISNAAIYPVISWQDRRSHALITSFQSQIAEIYQKTGLVLNPHYGASKMRWCLDNIPEIKKTMKKSRLIFMPLAGFLIAQLLEEHPHIVDPANASRTLLMNINTGQWDQELLNLFGISVDCLPDIKPTRYDFGKLTINSQKVPLKICTGDQNAMVFSQGVPSTRDIIVNAGTGAFILNVTNNFQGLEQSKLLRSILYSDSRQTLYAVEGTVNGAGRALQWLAEQHSISHYESLLEDYLQQCENPPIFINAIAGVGSPYWIADLQSYFEYASSIENQFTAVLESILFLITKNISLMTCINPDIKQILISGGLSKTNTFCQKLANLNNLPVIRTDDSEATAKGVYHLLSNETHCDDNSAQKTFHPHQSLSLQTRYAKWQKIMNHFGNR